MHVDDAVFVHSAKIIFAQVGFKRIERAVAGEFGFVFYENHSEMVSGVHARDFFERNNPDFGFAAEQKFFLLPEVPRD